MKIARLNLIGGGLSIRALTIVLGLAVQFAMGFQTEGAVAGDVALDFGSIGVGAEITRDFVMRNDSNTPLTIKTVQSSCTCLRIVSYSRAITANGEGRITVAYRSQRPGRANVEILAETDRASQPLLSLRLTGEVVVGTPVAAPSKSIASGGASPADNALESAELFVSAKDVDALGAKAMGVLLVDVREPRKFERAYIGGAVNYPIYALKTMGFLKRQHVVLLNEGHNDAELAQEAIALGREGFSSVRVLRGGLQAWRQAGGKLRGTASDSAAVVTLSPSDYYAAQGQEWLVVDLGRDSDPVLKNVLPSVNLPAEPDGKGLSAALGKLLESHPAAKRLLILSVLGDGYETVENAVKGGFPVPIYYLDGGTRRYFDFLSANTALQARHEVTLTGKLERSLATGVSTRRGKPCGTCP